MWIDFHTHILSGVDDGAKSVEQSVKMLRMLRKQGVECVALTPHFYAHRESVEAFLEKRQKAFEQLKKAIGHEKMPRLLLGAEIALECDLDEIEHLERLCLEGTRYLMMELPIQYHYMPWMLENAVSTCQKHGALPLLAHADRYIGVYDDEQLDNIVLESDALVQVNVASLLRRPLRKRVLKWIESGRPMILGSDAHNITSRKPQFRKGVRVLLKRASASAVERLKTNAQTVLRGGCPQKCE